MTDKPLTLVRLWQDNFSKELPSAWVEWDGGGFAIDRETPAGSAICHAMPSSQIFATVQSTDEIAWVIRSAEWQSTDGLLRVECVPYLEMLKTSLLRDKTRCEIWLEAERKWQESQRTTVRPANIADVEAVLATHFLGSDASPLTIVANAARALADRYVMLPRIASGCGNTWEDK